MLAVFFESYLRGNFPETLPTQIEIILAEVRTETATALALL